MPGTTRSHRPCSEVKKRRELSLEYGRYGNTRLTFNTGDGEEVPLADDVSATYMASTEFAYTVAVARVSSRDAEGC